MHSDLQWVVIQLLRCSCCTVVVNVEVNVCIRRRRKNQVDATNTDVSSQLVNSQHVSGIIMHQLAIYLEKYINK